jgi:Thioredoxin
VEVRLLVAAVVSAVALVVARLLERRRPAPPARDAYPVPAQLDRADFPHPETPWLVVLFSARTCDTCGPMALKVAALQAADVATCELEASEAGELHRRYRIEGVPMVVVADSDGVVRAGFVGTVPLDELIAALAAARAGRTGSAGGLR